MFGYMFKSLPAQYIFAGYNVRKSLSIVTSNIDDKIVYDVFLYTYIDNYLSFYLLMDDGKYKCVDGKVNVDLLKVEDISSQHLFRGEYYDTSEFPQYDKDQIVGVYGVRGMMDLIKQVDKMHKDNGSNELKLEAMLGEKSQYTGMEVNNVINSFNKALLINKELLTVPPVNVNDGDTYPSVIGNMNDYMDLFSHKDADQVVKDIASLYHSLDGVGNVTNQEKINEVLSTKYVEPTEQ